MTRRARPARARAPARGLLEHFSAWLTRHAQVAVSSLGQLTRTPGATSMTTLLIGIALALPASLHVSVESLRAVMAAWDRSTQVSVFLKTEVDDRKAAALGEAGSRWPEVDAVHVLTRAEALAEYRTFSGMGELVDSLDANPLPAVLLVQPHPGPTPGSGSPGTPGAPGALVDRLAALPEADGAQFDLEWVRRLQAIAGLGERTATVLAGALGLAVLLVIANTTRMTIQGRRDEIEISKLFGATDAFVRRPFLYTGLWYGVLGGIAAWLCLGAVGLALGGPVARLAALYGSDFRLQGMGAGVGAALVLGGGLLGLLGAWLAVSRYLRAVKP